MKNGSVVMPGTNAIVIDLFPPVELVELLDGVEELELFPPPLVPHPATKRALAATARNPNLFFNIIPPKNFLSQHAVPVPSLVHVYREDDNYADGHGLPIWLNPEND